MRRDPLRRLAALCLRHMLWRWNRRERLADPALEARARAISATLRCLVCQNESIDDSGADLAHDIRVLVRERLLAGDTDAQAVQAIVDRYGAVRAAEPAGRAGHLSSVVRTGRRCCWSGSWAWRSGSAAARSRQSTPRRSTKRNNVASTHCCARRITDAVASGAGCRSVGDTGADMPSAAARHRGCCRS